MSFDSRLFRPRRSNSSSASSALVSVGVTSVGRRTRSGGLAGRTMASTRRLLLAQPGAEPLAERSDHGADDALDMLVGQGALVVADLEADGEAALADGDAGRALRRLEDVEQRRTAHGALPGGVDRLLQPRVVHVAADDDRDVTPRR